MIYFRFNHIDTRDADRDVFNRVVNLNDLNQDEIEEGEASMTNLHHIMVYKREGEMLALLRVHLCGHVFHVTVPGVQVDVTRGELSLNWESLIDQIVT